MNNNSQSSLMDKYLDFIARYPKSIVFIILGVTAFFSYQILFLNEDSNPYLFPEDHPARASMFDFQDRYTGVYDSLLVAFYNKDSVFNKASLNAIHAITTQSMQMSLFGDEDLEHLQAISDKYKNSADVKQFMESVLADGVDRNDALIIRDYLQNEDQRIQLSDIDAKFLTVTAERLDPVREMSGLSATPNIYLEDDGTLRGNRLLDQPDFDPQKIEDLVNSNEMYDMGVVSQSGTVALIAIELSILQDDAEGQLKAYQAVAKIIDEQKANNPQLKDDIYLGGTPAFFAEQKKIMDADFVVLVPMVLILVSSVLLLFFRTFLGLAIPMSNVILCTIWTFGAMSMLNIPMDLITSALPVFLVTICSSDAVHVMAEYYNQRRTKINSQAVVDTMRIMFSPVILTTVTTCVTYIICTMTSIESLQNFGISMSFGMFVAMIISLLLIPAWLTLLKDKELKQIADGANKNYLISGVLLACAQPIINNRKIVIAGFCVVLIGIALIASKVNIDDKGSGYFSTTNDYRIADDFINNNIAGSSPGWIEIDTLEEDGALKLDTVLFVDKLEKFIHQHKNVTYSYSLPKYIKRINYVLNDMSPEYNRLPKKEEKRVEINEQTGVEETIYIAGEDIVRQAILMYENGGGSGLSNILSEDFSKTLLLYTMNTTVASDYTNFLEILRPWLDENIPQGLEYTLAGTPVIWSTVLDELIHNQFTSILISFLCVLLIMSLWLRSFKMGFAGTLPLIITVLCYFALMTLLDIELNIGTSIISFLVLGIVDYSVHYLLRIKDGLKSGLDIDASLLHALRFTGRSIIANVFIFSIGFVALFFSEFRPIVDLGILVAVSLLISGIMSLFVITLLAPWLISKPDDQPLSSNLITT